LDRNRDGELDFDEFTKYFDDRHAAQLASSIPDEEDEEVKQKPQDKKTPAKTKKTTTPTPVKTDPNESLKDAANTLLGQTDQDGKLAKLAQESKRSLIKELRKIFKDFDEDKNNRIDRGELGKMLRHLGKRPLAKKIDALFNTLDADGDGSIDFDEFCQYFTNEYYADDEEVTETQPQKEIKVQSPKKDKTQTQEKESKKRKAEDQSPKESAKKQKPDKDEDEVKILDAKIVEPPKQNVTPTPIPLQTQAQIPIQTPTKAIPILQPKDFIIQWFRQNPHEAVKRLTNEVALMDYDAILNVSKADWTAAAGGNVLAATSILTYLTRFLA